MKHGLLIALGGQPYKGRGLPFPAGQRSVRVSAPQGGNIRVLPTPVSASRGRGAHAIALILAGVATFAVGSTAAPKKAHAVCSVLSHHPCTPYFGSVFSHHPFTPYSCGVFSRPGCTPELLFPLNQVPLLKVHGHVGPPDPLDREHPVDRIDELGPLLSNCLELPPDDEAQVGMQVSLKLAFKRDGELLADPRFTYTTHDAPEKVKAAYQAAALDMLKHCTTLPVTY